VLAGAVTEQLVFGSFRSEDNATGWARQLEDRFDRDFLVERVHRDDGVWFRVRSAGLSASEREALESAAQDQGLRVWVVRGTYDRPGTVTSSAPPEVLETPSPALAATPPGSSSATSASRSAHPAEDRVDVYADRDLGLQTRT
jgi:hypothetical protein